ncbi:hypothetical protein NITGR_720026 [Nitrospina gracilis 3/211]|uniref:Lcl C-terminal domain-containing protein n=1 Tax=Nitrospina gracilis (strain 3/211) TaxID=1266370 RepID=M1ZDI3_NITG3|nr:MULTISPECIES: DUF1566 domain-containing protein [Nitrospina]MCF8724379.1 hypothetical protein [Nitrospina sp. Nb-3]CCQ91533.1 hypothetical protein NITGR_720026 [Nitrospina gracilis 3/211]
MNDQPRFVDNGDGTIQDNKTGLAWAKKDSFQIAGDWVNFQEALQLIDQLNKKDYLGFHDWRMPEKEEIAELYNPEFKLNARSNKEIHISDLFEPGCGIGSWCLPFDQQAAFYFEFQGGNAQHYDQDFTQGYVRPVRLWPDD